MLLQLRCLSWNQRRRQGTRRLGAEERTGLVRTPHMRCSHGCTLPVGSQHKTLGRSLRVFLQGTMCMLLSQVCLRMSPRDKGHRSKPMEVWTCSQISPQSMPRTMPHQSMSQSRRTTSELATAQPKASEKKNTNIKQHFVFGASPG
jgi:hypothetical protein